MKRPMVSLSRSQSARPARRWLACGTARSSATPNGWHGADARKTLKPWEAPDRRFKRRAYTAPPMYA
nr:hypothetical protein [Tanacetum cinerariifolium]